MGFTKAHMMEYEDKGYSEPPEKFVCSNHFEDSALVNFIEENSEDGICSYCKLRYQNGKVLPLEILVDFIHEGISYFYGDPNDEAVGWDSSEGGWIGAEVFDSYELLTDEISLEIDNDKLFDDIHGCFTDSQWCQIDPYGLTESEELISDWNNFSNLLKHKIRYVFFRTKKFDDDNYSKKAHAILEEVCRHIDKLNLIKELKTDSHFFRARQHENENDIKSISDIASPPDRFARMSNRMSPVGVSMFYGAFDRITAIKETRNEKNEKEKFISVAQLTNINDLQIIDLTKLPPIPSIFDKENRKYYYSTIFLSAFVYELSKEIKRDGKEHIEYVPTQVVTEFIRYVFPEISNYKIDGLIYPSSKTKKGKCCVLFFDHRESIKNFSINNKTIKVEKIK